MAVLWLVMAMSLPFVVLSRFNVGVAAYALAPFPDAVSDEYGHVGHSSGPHGLINNHTKRQTSLSDQQWQAAIEKGRKFSCLMNMNIEDADNYQRSTQQPLTQSQWTDYNELFNWGWERITQPPDWWGGEANVPNAAELREFGITDANWTSNGGTLTYAKFAHTRDYTHLGAVHHGTGAAYEAMYDPVQGAVYVPSTMSPRAVAPDRRDPNLPPGPFQWSDVTFLAWQQINVEEQPDMTTHIRWIFRISVANAGTLNVLQTAVERFSSHSWDEFQDGLWDARVSFDANTDPGHAVLSTPNVYGIAWFLIQHKQRLGETRSIRRIVFWNDPDVGIIIAVKIQ